jgi:3-oxoacyl-[acyl-carrier protein] reductase
MSEFSHKVVVVTGAGRGIGQAVALRFASLGASVAVISRTEANAQSTAEEINSRYPGMARAYAADVADFAAMQETGKRVLADFERVHILVNNAGVTRDGLCLRMTEEDWDVVLDTNLKGAFSAVKAFQRALIKQTSSRIVNIGSVIGFMGNAGQANYAASKAGLIGFTKSLAREYASRGLTANVIAPGFILTDMTGVLKEELRTTVLRQIPCGSFGTVDDVAHAAVFLAGDGARYITGQVLVVDGGMVM